MASSQSNDLMALLASLNARLQQLEVAPTTAREKILEANVESLQAQVDKLKVKVQLLRMQTSRGTGAKANKKLLKMPKYRRICKHGDGCAMKSCEFTHPKQRRIFGEAVDGLPDYVKGDRAKLKE